MMLKIDFNWCQSAVSFNTMASVFIKIANWYKHKLSTFNFLKSCFPFACVTAATFWFMIDCVATEHCSFWIGFAPLFLFVYTKAWKKGLKHVTQSKGSLIYTWKLDLKKLFGFFIQCNSILFFVLFIQFTFIFFKVLGFLLSISIGSGSCCCALT